MTKLFKKGNIIFGLIPIIAFIALTTGFFITKYKNSKTNVALSTYNGEYKKVLLEGQEYLKTNYPVKEFNVIIYVGDDKNFNSFAGGNGIVLSVLNMSNKGWREDFNRVADEWGFEHLTDQEDNALFLLFHEYRHLLQDGGFVVKMNVLEQTPERLRKIIPYRFIPNESDADWFGLSEVPKFKQKSQ